MAVAAIAAAAGCKRRGERQQNGEPEPAATAPEGEPDGGAGRSGPERERAVIRQVELELVDPGAGGGSGGDSDGLSGRELAQMLGRQLVESGAFAALPRDVPDTHRPRPATVHLRVAYDRRTTRRGARVMAVAAAVEARIEWADRGDDLAPADNVLIERAIEVAGETTGRSGASLTEADIAAAHVVDAVRRAGEGLIAKERIRTAGEDELRAILTAQPGAAAGAGGAGSGDAGAGVSEVLAAELDRMAWALEVVADRRQTALFDAVVAALGVEHEAIRNRALTALVALGDPRAVDALARRAQFQDLVFLQMVIEACAALGGDEARAYLEFLASGHDSDAIRRRARESLERLSRRDRAAEDANGGANSGR